jgi:hypothetical protein
MISSADICRCVGCRSDADCGCSSGTKRYYKCSSNHQCSKDLGVCSEACGGSGECDGKNPGDSCGTNRVCDNNCFCVCNTNNACYMKAVGDYCGTNGACDGDCNCCETSDSDLSYNIIVKGTATGLVCVNRTYAYCGTGTDECKSNTTLREYYVAKSHSLGYDDVDCSSLNCPSGKKGVCIDGACTCVECLKDSDCLPNDSIKGKCDSPFGTDNPDTLGYTYTCYWKPCKSDDECVSGTYCYCGYCSSSFTSAGCPAGQCCNRRYGGSEPGSCVSAGTISGSYICDPPE